MKLHFVAVKNGNVNLQGALWKEWPFKKCFYSVEMGNLRGRYEKVPGQQSSQAEDEDDEGYSLTAVETKNQKSPSDTSLCGETKQIHMKRDNWPVGRRGPVLHHHDASCAPRSSRALSMHSGTGS